ncbi:prepilin-type N-terminal cleavage/methylation domain-containing protein [Pseudomonas aeruginosa]|nr:prepilin-type N-terminal cleavage/methylation domain-containing protein [Pseudomonas aeruginosa]MBH9467964.1 prepilin-type N-terminal cleavage/methylation domain-containing protein [Pseudomonas aeruginosa]
MYSRSRGFSLIELMVVVVLQCHQLWKLSINII